MLKGLKLNFKKQVEASEQQKQQDASSGGTKVDKEPELTEADKEEMNDEDPMKEMLAKRSSKPVTKEPNFQLAPQPEFKQKYDFSSFGESNNIADHDDSLALKTSIDPESSNQKPIEELANEIWDGLIKQDLASSTKYLHALEHNIFRLLHASGGVFTQGNSIQPTSISGSAALNPFCIEDTKKDTLITDRMNKALRRAEGEFDYESKVGSTSRAAGVKNIEDFADREYDSFVDKGRTIFNSLMEKSEKRMAKLILRGLLTDNLRFKEGRREYLLLVGFACQMVFSKKKKS